MSQSTSRAAKTARNAIYGFSTWLLPLGISFVATPVIVKSLGHNGYGVYALVLGFIGYSFNFNTGRAVTKYVAEYSATSDAEGIRGAVSTTLAINLIIGTIGAVTISLLAPWLIDHLFRIDPGFRDQALRGFYLAAAIIFLTMQSQVFMSAIQGYQRYDLFSKLSNAASFVTIGGNLVLALLGYGLVALLGWNAAVIGCNAVLAMMIARRLLPSGALALRPTRLMLGTIVRFSAGVVGYQIVSNLVLLFERGWIVRQLGEEQLTYYVVPMTLGIYLHALVSSILLVLFPLSSEIGDDRPKLLRMYITSNKLVWYLVGFGALFLILESRLLLTLWVGPELAERAAPVLVVHALTFAIAGGLVVTWNMVEGLGHPSYNFLVYSLCFVVSVGGMIALTNEYGIMGAALSRLAGFGILTFSVAYVERWVFGEIQFRFWLGTAGSVGIALAASGLIVYLAGNLLGGWPLLVGAGVVGGLAYTGILFAIGFIGAEELAIVRRLAGRG